MNHNVSISQSHKLHCLTVYQFVWLIEVQSRPINLEIISLSLKGLVATSKTKMSANMKILLPIIKLSPVAMNPLRDNGIISRLIGLN